DRPWRYPARELFDHPAGSGACCIGNEGGEPTLTSQSSGGSVVEPRAHLGRWLKLLAPGVVENMALAALKDEVKPR
ncbi:MAG: hypothetical protein ACK4MJ_09695, partial [Hylemonella sp.]